MTRFPKFASLAVAAIVLSLAFAGCSQQGETPTEETERVTPVTDGDAQAGNYGIEPGQTPPPFTLLDLDGNEVSLSDFKGDVVMIDLWATWCPPCRKEIPFLVSLYEQYTDQGLSIVGVALDQQGASVVAPWVEANDVSYTIVLGDQEISRKYKVSAIPMTLTLDRNGIVATKDVGFTPQMEAAMRAKVEELLSQPATEA